MAGEGTIPGRECGACDACCVLFEIQDSRIGKPAGMRCSQLCEAGCASYHTRPQVCRDWLCVWRLLPSVPQHWRPDLSGILIYQARNTAPGYDGTALVLSLAKGVDHLKDDEFLGFILMGVKNRQPIYLGVHGLAEGKHTGSADQKALFINPPLEQAVARNDRDGFVTILRLAIEQRLTARSVSASSAFRPDP